MSEAEKKPAPYELPKGSRKDFRHETLNLSYEAVAEWIPLEENNRTAAEVFSCAYFLKGPNKKRPITFVFNGGPGASSAYLHIGALGPSRIVFLKDGQLPKAPSQLCENEQTWLAFTDLVFVDPVGTGFSKNVENEASGKAEKKPDFYSINKDIQSLCHFVSKFLSKFKRWDSPVFIAGESYGGYRVGRLARALQENSGVGLNGAIAISPALELNHLNFTDYDVVPWIQVYPSYVLSAQIHGLSQTYSVSIDRAQVLKEAESFAQTELAKVLIQGDALPAGERDQIFSKMSKDLGVSLDVIQTKFGRLPLEFFCRELLRSARKVIGLYDSSLTATDPFPDREKFEGADPTLFGIDRVFSGGINTQLRDVIGVDVEREYQLLNMEVFKGWKIESRSGSAFDLTDLGASDDLRYASTLNAHMKVFISHGYFDLVTPYFSSELLVRKMKLSPEQRANFRSKNYNGGHMFYTWESSRREFFEDAKSFYSEAL